MRLLANENVPRAAIDALRSAGHDVLWARTDLAGYSDDAILARAQTEERVALTFDKDFGELAYRWGLPAVCGVILFRIGLASPAYVADRAVEVLEGRDDWLGQFAIVEESRIRLRSLPRSSDAG
ncbi:MAG: DUF5615 family PIN-like protein [Candidatus Hydrogenedentota bacterium]